MGMSFGHLMLLMVIVLVIFGAGKLPQVMGDLAKGVKAFKDGMKDNNDESKDSGVTIVQSKTDKNPEV
jgi:sec-independent protein translocase protein TatA